MRMHVVFKLSEHKQPERISKTKCVIISNLIIPKPSVLFNQVFLSYSKF